jgi:serine protease Do
VLSFAGVKIIDVPQFRRVVARVAPGEEIEIEILRNGHRESLTTELAERADTFAAERKPEPEARPEWFGIDVVAVDDPAARELDVEADEGVLVTGVDSGGPADDGGLLVGDVIVEIGDEKIGNLSDYQRIMKNVEKSDRAIALMVQRGAHTYFVAIKPE